MDRRQFLLFTGAMSLAPKSTGGKKERHHVYSFAGSPYEIGRQHGTALRPEILAELQPSLRQAVAKSRKSEAEFLDAVVSRFEPLFRKHVPSSFEEIQGLADGASLPYPYAFYAATRDGMVMPAGTSSPACTAFCCGKETTSNHEVLIGQTKDTSAPLDRYRILHLAYRSGLRAVILNYPGWIGNLSINSFGLAACGNSLFGPSPAADTVPYSLLKRLVLEKQTIAEVLEALQGLIIENGCFLLAEAGGRMLVMEWLAGQARTWDVPGAFGHANTALAPALARFDQSLKSSRSSPIRQQRIQALLDKNKGRLSVEVLKRIASDHQGFPLSICRHPSEEDRSVTTAAFIANLTRLEVEIAIGNPCAAGFKEYRV